MEEFGNLMENYLIKMESRIREQIIEEILTKREEEPEKIWLNKTEMANYLGICSKTLNKFIKENPSFPSTNIAGAVRFNCNRVDEWMEIHDEVIKNRKNRRIA